MSILTLLCGIWIGTKVLGNSHWIVYPPSIFWFGAPHTPEPVSFGNLFDLELNFFFPFLGSISGSGADRNLPVGCSKMQKNNIRLCTTWSRNLQRWRFGYSFQNVTSYLWRSRYQHHWQGQSSQVSFTLQLKENHISGI